MVNENSGRGRKFESGERKFESGTQVVNENTDLINGAGKTVKSVLTRY